MSLIQCRNSYILLYGQYTWVKSTMPRSRYAQWRGWENVLQRLKRLHPEIVIDNRLSAHGLGPWHMLAGSYDEPIAGDENPET